jgi:hypothetical protein
MSPELAYVFLNLCFYHSSPTQGIADAVVFIVFTEEKGTFNLL